LLSSRAFAFPRNPAVAVRRRGQDCKWRDDALSGKIPGVLIQEGADRERGEQVGAALFLKREQRGQPRGESGRREQERVRSVSPA